MDTPEIVAALITEDTDEIADYFAAVAVVECRGRWLLGLARADDDRDGHWCCPGGGIKPGETPEEAAVRECFEETGVRCRAAGTAFAYGGKPGVAFVHCRADRWKHRFKPNSEFTALGFFTKDEMRSLKLYHNVRNLVELCK